MGVLIFHSVIRRARPGADTDVLTKEGKFMLALADELLEHHGLSADTRNRALEVIDSRQLADLVLTVGFYQLVCGFLNTFGVQVENENAQ